MENELKFNLCSFYNKIFDILHLSSNEKISLAQEIIKTFPYDASSYMHIFSYSYKERKSDNECIEYILNAIKYEPYNINEIIDHFLFTIIQIENEKDIYKLKKKDIFKNIFNFFLIETSLNLYQKNKIDGSSEIIFELLSQDCLNIKGFLLLFLNLLIKKDFYLSLKVGLIIIKNTNNIIFSVLIFLKIYVVLKEYFLDEIEKLYNQLLNNNLSLYEIQSFLKEKNEIFQPKFFEYLLKMRNIYLLLNEIEEAILVNSAALDLSPQNMHARYLLIGLYRKKKDFQNATKQIENAFKIDTKWGEGYRQLAYIYEEKGQKEQALLMALKSIDNISYPLHYLEYIIYLYEKNNDMENMKKYADLGLETDINWAPGHYILYLYYKEKKMIDNALDEINEALKLNKNNFNYRWRLCSLYRQKKDYKNAQRILDEGFNINPYWLEGFRQQAYIHQAHGDIDKALLYAQKSIDAKKFPIHYREYVADLLLKSGDIVDAEKCATDGLKSDPQWAHGYWILSLVLKEKANFDEAIENCKKAIEISSKNIIFKKTLNDLIDKKEKYDKKLRFNSIEPNLN